MSLLPADPSSNPPDYPLPMAAPGRLVMRPGGGMPARMGATAPAAEGGPSFGVLLKGLRRHLGLALVLGLFCAGLTAIVTWYVLPLPKYTATALLQVHSREQHIVKGVDGDVQDAPADVCGAGEAPRSSEHGTARCRATVDCGSLVPGPRQRSGRDPFSVHALAQEPFLRRSRLARVMPL